MQTTIIHCRHDGIRTETIRQFSDRAKIVSPFRVRHGFSRRASLELIAINWADSVTYMIVQTRNGLSWPVVSCDDYASLREYASRADNIDHFARMVDNVD